MNIFLKGAIAALALSLVGVSGAEAQVLVSGQPPGCSEWTAAVGGTWDGCSGAWADNDSNQQVAVANEILSQGWLTSGPITLLAGGELAQGATTGTINFGSLYTNFVIALKAGNSFSLYHFEGGLTTLAYNTIGSGEQGTSGDGPTNALSHWNIYGGTTTSVPEPGTLLLLGTGILAMAMLRRREDVV